jgi:hypothetical protein
MRRRSRRCADRQTVFRIEFAQIAGERFPPVPDQRVRFSLGLSVRRGPARSHAGSRRASSAARRARSGRAPRQRTRRLAVARCTKRSRWDRETRDWASDSRRGKFSARFRAGAARDPAPGFDGICIATDAMIRSPGGAVASGAASANGTRQLVSDVRFPSRPSGRERSLSLGRPPVLSGGHSLPPLMWEQFTPEESTGRPMSPQDSFHRRGRRWVDLRYR